MPLSEVLRRRMRKSLIINMLNWFLIIRLTGVTGICESLVSVLGTLAGVLLGYLLSMYAETKKRRHFT